jgi:hypothetical protein
MAFQSALGPRGSVRPFKASRGIQISFKTWFFPSVKIRKNVTQKTTATMEEFDVEGFFPEVFFELLYPQHAF